MTERHLRKFERDVASHGESRAYSWGYNDGFDAALALPIDHPGLESLKEALRADGWEDPADATP